LLDNLKNLKNVHQEYIDIFVALDSVVLMQEKMK